MKISLCNEVLRNMEFSEQCSYAARLGYDGIELAPFTLSQKPHRLSRQRRQEIRTIAEDAGVPITGLHWLLVTPEGLSITTADAGVRMRTLEVMKGLVELCSDLGGSVLIHGSPKQRELPSGEEGEAPGRAEEIFAAVCETAEEWGVTYCIEALSPAETNYINNLEQAVALVNKVRSPAFKTMLDTKAAFTGEDFPVDELLDRWLPEGVVAHVHFNDRNLRGPGQGLERFTPIVQALIRNGYRGRISVEPFDYFPDAKGCAARAIGYLRGIFEALEL